MKVGCSNCGDVVSEAGILLLCGLCYHRNMMVRECGDTTACCYVCKNRMHITHLHLVDFGFHEGLRADYLVCSPCVYGAIQEKIASKFGIQIPDSIRELENKIKRRD